MTLSGREEGRVTHTHTHAHTFMKSVPTVDRLLSFLFSTSDIALIVNVVFRQRAQNGRWRNRTLIGSGTIAPQYCCQGGDAALADEL